MNGLYYGTLTSGLYNGYNFQEYVYVGSNGVDSTHLHADFYIFDSLGSYVAHGTKTGALDSSTCSAGIATFTASSLVYSMTPNNGSPSVSGTSSVTGSAQTGSVAGYLTETFN